MKSCRSSRRCCVHIAPLAALCAAALLASACGSVVPDRFYTLAGPARGVPRAAPAGFYIELMPVDVPQQVARSQWVVTTGPGQVDLLEHERWSAPLSDEVGRALSDELSRALGAIDVYRTPHPATAPVFRIHVNVQRFESAPGAYVGVEATWSVRALPDGVPVTCHSTIEEPVTAGYDALVAGHRRALQRLSDDIVGVVRKLVPHRSAPAPSAAAPASASAAAPRGRAGTGIAPTAVAPDSALRCPAPA
ncbi:PqiC family protein [Mycetohabitans sp. B8]|uniref:PqiC family protein n=1 Tax=Mycetohabitans sp. B8 TaxID=2841845 RepID=UPI001F3E0E35|nr:PqiC family protein [Mycetohabitans sp. B8]MCG1041435.1 PqiC family protein [Mycetohabitans sp. B8]